MPAEWGNKEFKLNAVTDKLPVIKHKEQSNTINQIEKSISRMRLELAKSDFPTTFILQNLKLKEQFKATQKGWHCCHFHRKPSEVEKT